MSTEPLTTYLNDHLAGATAALHMLDRLVDAADDPEAPTFFTGLREEIAEDRSVLTGLLERLGGAPSAVRQSGGWLMETLGRLKLQFDDPSRGTLKRLESLEGLALGILGKLALWTALAEVADRVPAVRELDLPLLQARARDQHARVEARRVQAAMRVLS